MIRHPYATERLKVALGDFGTSRTKQSFKKECDINNIMAKYQKTGAITHFAKYSAKYGEASSQDLLEAMQTITQANEMFAELPSNIRTRFGTPQAFLDFVQDEANADEMLELGLRETQSAPDPILVRVEPAPTPEPAPEPE